MHALRYCLGEAFGSLWRQRGSSALAMLTIAAATVVLGGFLVVTVNLDRALERWSAAAEFSVYLRDDIAQEQRVELNRILSASPVVAAHEFVSKADALARFTRDFPDLAAGLEGVPDNPLPASIEVRLRPQAADAGAVDLLAGQIREAPGVADVRFDRQWLARLASLVGALRWAGWLLGGVLVLAAVLTVSTVVRLAMHARRDEVEIMQLMGAPMGLLRGPLVIEGLLHGGGGALLALALLGAAYALVRFQAGSLLATYLPDLIGFLPAPIAVTLVAGGCAVGCVGGYMAARHVR